MSPHPAVQRSTQGRGVTVPGAGIPNPLPIPHENSHSCAEPHCGAVAHCTHSSEQSWCISFQQCQSAPHQWCLWQGCGSVSGEILQLSVFSAVLTSTKMLPSSASPVTTAQSTFLLQKTQKEISSQGRDGAVLKPWGVLELSIAFKTLTMSLSSKISTWLKVEKFICWAGVKLQI